MRGVFVAKYAVRFLSSFVCFAEQYVANHVTAVRCRCGVEKPVGPWASASTAHGYTPLTQTNARSFVSDEVLESINARALWGTGPQSDAELGKEWCCSAATY